MDTNSDEQFLVVKATIEDNNQEADKNHKYTNDKLTQLTDNLQVLIALMTDKTNISKSSPAQKDTSDPPYPTTVVLANRRATPLEGVNSHKIGGT